MDLYLETQRRNARFRAWRAYGVPVEGGWSNVRIEDGQQYASAGLQLGCGTCGRAARTVCGEEWYHKDPVDAEWVVLTGLDAGTPLCVHLAPLLEDDPPEVQALWELELLAGD